MRLLTSCLLMLSAVSLVLLFRNYFRSQKQQGSIICAARRRKRTFNWGRLCDTSLSASCVYGKHWENKDTITKASDDILNDVETIYRNASTHCHKVTSPPNCARSKALQSYSLTTLPRWFHIQTPESPWSFSQGQTVS